LAAWIPDTASSTTKHRPRWLAELGGGRQEDLGVWFAVGEVAPDTSASKTVWRVSPGVMNFS
jgi:hypothetical protein